MVSFGTMSFYYLEIVYEGRCVDSCSGTFLVARTGYVVCPSFIRVFCCTNANNALTWCEMFIGAAQQLFAIGVTVCFVFA